MLRRELSNEWQYHGVSMCEDGDGVRVGRGYSGSICTSLCLLRRELSNEWQYHGVSMCEDGDGFSMCGDGVRVVMV